MKKYLLICLLFFLAIPYSLAETKQTIRVPQFTNDKVNVWKTIIYPHKKQILKSHRHELDRVLVALSDGTLKIIDSAGNTDYLQLKQGEAYYLTKDPPDLFHTDENIGSHPITVMVIELKR